VHSDAAANSSDRQPQNRMPFPPVFCSAFTRLSIVFTCSFAIDSQHTTRLAYCYYATHYFNSLFYVENLNRTKSYNYIRQMAISDNHCTTVGLRFSRASRK